MLLKLSCERQYEDMGLFFTVEAGLVDANRNNQMPLELLMILALSWCPNKFVSTHRSCISNRSSF